jgi:hypothetical protein
VITKANGMMGEARVVFPKVCGKVLKARYFPNSDILHYKAQAGISYTWESIIHGIDLLNQGIIWRIGFGS